MTNHDDSDMKIFNPGTDCPEEDANDLGNLAALLECHRQNGNTEKAKSLGERLAVLTPDTSSGIDLYDLLEGADLPDEVMNQVRILLVFTAQNTLHEQLCPPLLSSCAVNAMYDKLVETEPAFYDGISDGAAFTFYALSVRKGEDVDENIGENFAMLCGNENNAAYRLLGTKTYQTARSLITRIVDEYNFVDC